MIREKEDRRRDQRDQGERESERGEGERDRERQREETDRQTEETDRGERDTEKKKNQKKTTRTLPYMHACITNSKYSTAGTPTDTTHLQLLRLSVSRASRADRLSSP